MLATIKRHSETALKSKYGRVLVVAFFIPEATAVIGGGWALIEQFAK